MPLALDDAAPSDCDHKRDLPNGENRRGYFAHSGRALPYYLLATRQQAATGQYLEKDFARSVETKTQCFSGRTKTTNTPS